jgi:hypothetical protein
MFPMFCGRHHAVFLTEFVGFVFILLNNDNGIIVEDFCVVFVDQEFNTQYAM